MCDFGKLRISARMFTSCVVRILISSSICLVEWPTVKIRKYFSDRNEIFGLSLHYFYVVGIALLKTGLRDSDEVRFTSHLGDVHRAAVAHAGL